MLCASGDRRAGVFSLWTTACRHKSAIQYTDSMILLLIDSQPLGLGFTKCIQIQDRAMARLDAPEKRLGLNVMDAPRKQTMWI